MLSKGALYYTDSQLDERIAVACRNKLRESFEGEIVSVSLKPLDFGDRSITLPLQRSYLAMFKQILAGLEASTADIIFMTEHDVLYPKEHFDFTPLEKDKFYYDLNWYKIGKGDLAVHWDAVQVSGLCAYKELLMDYYRKRIEEFDLNNFDRKFEPTINTEYKTWWAEKPHIDIRHNSNLTYNKWKLDHFRDKSTAVNFQESSVDKIPGWESSDILAIIK
jgi:hypothetical protein